MVVVRLWAVVVGCMPSFPCAPESLLVAGWLLAVPVQPSFRALPEWLLCVLVYLLLLPWRLPSQVPTVGIPIR